MRREYAMSKHTELRSIHEYILKIAAQLQELEPHSKAHKKLLADLLNAAERLDKQISITPVYTGSGNSVLASMVQELANEMFGKMEALAMEVDPRYIAYGECLSKCLEQRGEDAACDDCEDCFQDPDSCKGEGSPASEQGS